MTREKFINEVTTLTKFIQTFCDDKHGDLSRQESEILLDFKGENGVTSAKFCLCDECKTTLFYALARLSECPHEIKPRCRKCPNPCYEKEMYKKMAKIMVHSGVKLGLSKLKKSLLGYLKGKN